MLREGEGGEKKLGGVVCSGCVKEDEQQKFERPYPEKLGRKNISWGAILKGEILRGGEKLC